ncbi:MAG: amino acid ABC transporter permease [Geminicoccaceae bacterium]
MQRIWTDLIEHPWAVWALAVCICILALAPFDLSGVISRLAAPEDAGPSPRVLHWLGVVALSFAFVANLWAISRLPFQLQVFVAWVELLALFLLFFYSFNLSYDYIFGRLRFLLGIGLQNGFLMGAALTLFICFAAIIASTILALAAALGRLSGNGIAFGLSTFYTSFFRGTPLLLQILLVYLGLPQIGIVLTPIPSAVIALSLCYGAYSAEIFRAGILAIPGGQREAARALGLRESLIMGLIVLPQALRLIIPPLGNQFIAMLKDSSLVSVLGAWELMYMARTHGRAEFKYMEMLIAAALIYWAMSVAFEYVQARLERRFGRGATS